MPDDKNNRSKSISMDFGQTAPHDGNAKDHFANFLQRITVGSPDPDWSVVPTCIVDSGDLTTFGDLASLDLGSNYLQTFGAGRHLVTIYGNHDAWPECWPFVAGGAAIRTQTSRLQTRYRVHEAGYALSFPIPHGGGEVQLYTADSTIHDDWFNSFACGEVDQHQIDLLGQLIDTNSRRKERDLRVLVVHHPVHFPSSGFIKSIVNLFIMGMRNRTWVGQRLDGGTPSQISPMVHLVLSGHIHAPFPEPGRLPTNVQNCNHPSLGSDQCQLVVGSLMQMSKEIWAKQCQLLRFYYFPSDHGSVLMTRLFASLGGGVGPYEFMPDPSTGMPLEEEIVFRI